MTTDFSPENCDDPESIHIPDINVVALNRHGGMETHTVTREQYLSQQERKADITFVRWQDNTAVAGG